MRADLEKIAEPGKINGDPFDRYTIVHFTFGTILGAVGMPSWSASMISIGWELIESTLKDQFPELFPHASHDTAANALIDAGAMMAGWGAAKLLRRHLKNGNR